MRLPFLRSKPDAGGAPRPAAAADSADTLQAARTQARRRLIGSLVLLVAAVVGFPLLFETQPRPMPGPASADGAAVVIRGDAAGRSPGADSPAVRPALPAQTAASTPTTAAAIATATTSSAAAEQATAVAVAPASAAATTPAKSAATSAITDASAAAPAAAPEPVARTPAKAAPAASAGAAVAAAKVVAAAPLVAKPATQAAATKAPEPAVSAASASVAEGAVRWVVQVGAYNDMERMRQARQKAEKLGFKTYITDVDTPTGKRTRVRLGPFATKKDADAAAVKVKANGMAANVLSLQ